MKPLHSYNALRSSFLRGMTLSHVTPAATDIKGLRVVDVGCGGGIRKGARPPSTLGTITDQPLLAPSRGVHVQDGAQRDSN